MPAGNEVQRIPRPGCLAVLAVGWLAAGLVPWMVQAAPPAGPPELQLPASFIGNLPCAGCVDTRTQIDLWTEGTFHLHRQGSLGDPSQADEVGRWSKDPLTLELLLNGGREAPLRLAIVDQHTLRSSGTPSTGGSGVLTSDGRLRPADLSLRLHGMVHLDGESVSLAECLTGRRYPIAMEQDAAALTRDLRALPVGPSASAVLASFDGAIVQSAAAPAVIVRRLTGLWPGQSCERAMSHAGLANQYWRLGQLQGRPVPAFVSEEETHIILREAPGGYVANAGCGRFAGDYRAAGTTIAFDPSIEPLPACPAELEARQRRLQAALAAARYWAIQGQVLELFDAHRNSLAAFEAIYLR